MCPFATACSILLSLNLLDSPTPDDVRAYQQAAAAVGRDAGAHVRLASWCESHGLIAERHKHLAIALEIDPDHPGAHGLLGQVADKGEWRMPSVVIDDHRGDAAVATLALYRARRDKIPETAQAHWQLADWCDQNDLKAEAMAHLTAVVRLNPGHEDAWKKLGFRKQKGRWTAPEQVAAPRGELEAQHRADAKWTKLLQKWTGWLAKKTRQPEAEAAMAQVHDPRAVPAIWKVLIAGGPADQERGVLLLAQIDAPAASRALASLAVLGTSERVRTHAAATLLRRDPREFAPFLISLLRDPIKYEVRPVEGPGKPGELYVHGQKANSRFFYAAPPPLTSLRPTDIVGFDNDGLPVATRVVGYMNQPIAAAIDPLLSGAPDLTGAPAILGQVLGPAGVQLGQRMLANQQQATANGLAMEGAAIFGGNSIFSQKTQNLVANTQLGAGFGPTVPMPLTAQVPVGRLMMQAQQQAAYSRAKLEEDVASLDRYNKDVNQVNDRATAALETSLMENHGPERSGWAKWWTALVASYTSASPTNENNKSESSHAPVEKRAILPALGADTSVWTLTGLQPARAIRAGDLVLTQDTSTGALTFAPVLTVHRTEHQLVKKLTFGDAQVFATEIERFWVAGKGWSMALDLKPGDAVRGLGDVVRVTAIDDGGIQPVFHVQVPPGHGIIVSERGLLAHDERVAHPGLSLFDAGLNQEAAQPAMPKED